MFERKVSKSGQVVQPDPTDPAYIVVASVSGGKDSTAMCLWLKEQGIEHRRVCMDTGWEHPDWRGYVEDYLQEQLGPIEILEPPLPMVDLIKKKGMFPSRMKRFCTEQLKIVPLFAKLEEMEKETGRQPLNTVGIRAQESAKRALLPEWDIIPILGYFIWRPIINWSERAVIEMHQKHNIRPNPLYLKGASRVGCWPCIHARKREIKLVADISPERIQMIRDLEAEVAEAARLRYAAKGETFESLGYTEPTFFQAQGALRNPKHGKGGRCVKIDEAVAWSRTSYGGKQYEMFASETEGCIRWGLCEGTGMPDWAKSDDE